ncbi:MAG: ferric reductase [Hyphomicrobiales bacterium]|nr:MAG: ferric reductase [Hyphomicrobiales bacterium]
MIWGAFAISSAIPIAVAAASPLIAWRDPIYIAAGLAGVIALVLMLAQPLLIGGYLPGLSALRRRKIHRWIGSVLVATVVAHIIGLWITSPPDVVDALLFRSPTQFSVWGVIAMWAVFATALLAALRSRLRLHMWRLGHITLVTIAIVGSLVHAMQIEGTMGIVSKTVLCAMVLLATVKVVVDLRLWAIRTRRA